MYFDDGSDCGADMHVIFMVALYTYAAHDGTLVYMQHCRHENDLTNVYLQALADQEAGMEDVPLITKAPLPVEESISK